MIVVSEGLQKNLIKTLDKMSHSIKIAWNLFKKLNGDPKQNKLPPKATSSKEQTYFKMPENQTQSQHPN